MDAWPHAQSRCLAEATENRPSAVTGLGWGAAMLARRDWLGDGTKSVSDEVGRVGVAPIDRSGAFLCQSIHDLNLPLGGR